jgi:hypothetical protein
MADPRGFLTTPRQGAPTRPIPERVRDWREVYVPGGLLPVVSKQAGRCMDCGIPFCHQGCPLGNLIPDWNDLVYRDRWHEAIDQPGAAQMQHGRRLIESRPVPLELSSRRFDQWAVVHTGRTDRLAGAAIEALVHLLVEERVKKIESLVGDLSTEELLRGLGMQVFWIVVMTGLTLFIWRFAVRRYSAVGN